MEVEFIEMREGGRRSGGDIQFISLVKGGGTGKTRRRRRKGVLVLVLDSVTAIKTINI